MEFENYKRKFVGSALILTIVLTSLLAIVGMLFVIASRVDRISSASVIDSRDMDSAVQTVVAILSQVLAEDVPGVAGQEYYDYPGDKDKWLAALEPYDDGSVPPYYKWSQISDVTGAGFVRYDLITTIIPEYPTITLDNQGNLTAQAADADGDGVADARWIELEDVRSSRGQPVYAAIRVIDNGGMLNVNTGWMFEPNVPNPQISRIDGTSQTQINFAALSQRGETNGSLQNEADDLQEIRNGGESASIEQYERDVIWSYAEPNGLYTPFDMSEELSLRNRYLIKVEDIETRLEDTDEPEGLEFWAEAYDGSKTLNTPLDNTKSPESEPIDWFYRVNNSSPVDNKIYDYRHISTIHNMDRIIDPNGNIMVNADTIEPNDAQRWYGEKLVDELLEQSAFYENLSGLNKQEKLEEFAQITANIVDYADADSDVTVVIDRASGKYHYGFETPCIYISEVTAYYWDITEEPCTPPIGPGPPQIINRSFAVELFMYPPDVNNENGIIRDGEWKLDFGQGLERTLPVDAFNFRGGNYYVMLFEDPSKPLLKPFIQYIDTPADGAINVDPRVVLSWPAGGFADEGYEVYFSEDRDLVEEKNSGVKDEPTDRRYDPNGSGPLAGLTDYYWRVDYIDSSTKDVLMEGSVLSFRTWDNSVSHVSLRDDIDLFDGGDDDINDIQSVKLWRKVDIPGLGEDWVLVDMVSSIEKDIFNISKEPPDSSSLRSHQRDVVPSRVIKRRWTKNREKHTLGYSPNHLINESDVDYIELGDFYGDNVEAIQARPEVFHNVGEIGNVFRKSTYLEDTQDEATAAINPDSLEHQVRINLADPDVQKLFQYLSVLYPRVKDETRIKGRININTAPWYVIAQLPWVSERESNSGLNSSEKYELAKAIVAYRDKLTEPVDYSGNFGRWNRIGNIIGPEISFLKQDYIREAIGFERKGFKSIGELALVINNVNRDEASIRFYSTAMKPGDQSGIPDFSVDDRTNGDGAADDFEERNLLFYRMSDLVTVRSDVFTAYILLRIGTDGPQKRFISILDRSNVERPGDKVRILALHSVPDPR